MPERDDSEIPFLPSATGAEELLTEAVPRIGWSVRPAEDLGGARRWT